MNYEFGTSILNIFSFEMKKWFTLGKMKMIKIQNCFCCKIKTCQDINNTEVMTQGRNVI